jgi:protein SCO1/2
LATVTLLGASAASAAEDLPRQARGVDIDDKRGERVDLDLAFTDQRGEVVHLRDYFDGKRAVLMTLNWYNCTTLCNTQLNQLLKTFGELEWTAGGDEFRVVTISIDPREDAELAAGKRKSYLEALGRGPDVDWSFLVGEPAAIEAIADQLGFRYRYDEQLDQYVHTTVVYAMTPDGVISRHLFGITYDPRELRLAIVDASGGRVGTSFDKLLLSCFHYDASLGRYSASAIDAMRFFGFVIVFALFSVLMTWWLTDRTRARAMTHAEALP